jgi:hypothetical protein
MSNNSIRIRTTPDGKDKYVKIKLDQEFDFIEVLSLKITQSEVYRNFCADYGVVVGRVFVNNGFGVPNARVSIFIPIEDVDKDDPIISGLYPYEIVSDRDIDGKRYNLLPKNSETDNDCYTPVGTFPNKREILDDPEMNHIYCKYYKFTTSTNFAGDYMIFGVPIGNYTVHVDADISDIGIASQRPYDSISQGAPIQMFDSPTKFKGGTNLDKLIQIKSINAGVNVQPFWGSVENCEIGISRIDLDLNYEIKPSAIFMGGAFGDTDNNSVNKNCRPRRRMGKICEQNTSEGTIEMIRKTLDGKIEKLDIEGGRLIDENGSWAYQVPMNLDYYYTNEFGDLVLSEDPNKGIPTRASVRFKIGMDVTGGEGRVRTRANHLVPHNPTNTNEIDYEFGELTKNVSFRDMYWNKIYSVSNFISRYQKSSSLNPVNDRNFVGLKDVDDCVGSKNPAPFNRVNTVFNPLFSIICLIMKIIEFLIWIINIILIPILNLVMAVINAIIGVLCGIIRTIRRILRKIGLRRAAPKIPKFCKTKYWIPCVGSFCPDRSEEGSKLYAPGCSGGLNEKGRETLESNSGSRIFTTTLGALSDCIAFQMAKLLNLFQFDFYNDWLNGSLYFFLAKYKKRRRREKYCNYDCSGNNCSSSVLFDTCYSTEDDSESVGVREGVIKKYNNELFYAASTKNGNYKMYATEIINLGSVFKCDWQGVPKIQEFLVPTTYIIPPTTDTLLDNSRTVDTSGQVEIGSVSEGLFFKISCLGIDVKKRQALNIRHACEFGVDLDETDFDDNGTQITANHILSSQEINSQYGKYVRDVLFGLNNTINNVNISLPYTTNFNPFNCAEYNFATIANNTCNTGPSNEVDYVNFRGYLNNTSFSQPKHSFYFYFGTVPGATGLEKMNNKFFTKCLQTLTLEFFIRIDETTAISEDNVDDGTATFTIISGVGPFDYTISGPNSYNTSGTLTQPNTTQTLNGLAQGTYTINVTDSNGLVITQTFEVSAPIPLYASANVSSNNTNISSPYNGVITLTSVGGGSGTYSATLYNSSGGIVTNNVPVTQLPLVFSNLPADVAPNTNNTSFVGYYIEVKDTSNPQQVFWIYNLQINGVTGLNVSVNTFPATCFDSTNGKITLTATGGIPPYAFETTGTTQQPQELFPGPTITTAPIGEYSVSVTDNSNPIQTYTSNVTIKSMYPQMILVPPTNLDLAKQCDPTQYKIKLKIQNGGEDINGQSYTERYSLAYYQFNFNGQVDSNDEIVWDSPETAVYNSAGEFEVIIPATTIFESVNIRLSNAEGTCGSNPSVDETEFEIGEMLLPPNVLSLNTIDIDNSRQCIPNRVSFRFNVSHLLLGQTYRAPYILQYQIFNPTTNSFGSTVIHPTPINQNQQLVTINNVTFNPVRLRVKVIDNVGCESSWLELNPIQLPSTELNENTIQWSSTPIAPNSTTCNKTYTITSNAGITPYTVVTGPQLSTANSGTSQFPCNFITSVTIKDSVGCTVTKNSL